MEDYIRDTLASIKKEDGSYLMESTKKDYLKKLMEIYTYLLDNDKIKQSRLNLNFISKYYDDILIYIKGNKDKRKYLSAMGAIIREDPIKYKKVGERIKDELEIIRTEDAIERNNRDYTPGSKAWIQLVKKVRKTIKKDIPLYDKVILTLFVLQPPRSAKDYTTMYLKKGHTNYYDKGIFVFGDNKIRLNEDASIIKKYIVEREKMHDKLFDIGEQALSKHVKEIFKKYTNEDITISKLKSQYSDYINDMNMDTEKAQIEMGNKNKYGIANWSTK